MEFEMLVLGNGLSASFGLGVKFDIF